MKRLINLYWYIYYSYNKPKTRSEILKRYSRVNGIKFKELKVSTVDMNDMIG